MKTSPPNHFRRLRLPVAAATILFMTLYGCASAPPAPTDKIDAAKVAIAAADGAEAGRFAAGELSEARAKLSSADTAVREEKMVLAEHYAEQARAAAELATAKTGAAKAKAVNDEMIKSTQTLVEEMQRKSGGTT